MSDRELVRMRNAVRGKENRSNGEAFEFRVLRKEKRNSLNVIRSAGSHSLVDIVSWKSNGEIWLISCRKGGVWTNRELSELRTFRSKLDKCNVVKLAQYVSKKKWTLTTLK